jgi:hypothetical protein
MRTVSPPTPMALCGFRKKLQPPHILPTNEEPGNRSDRDPLRLEVWNSREWMLLVSLPEASPTNPWLGLPQVGTCTHRRVG